MAILLPLLAGILLLIPAVDMFLMDRFGQQSKIRRRQQQRSIFHQKSSFIHLAAVSIEAFHTVDGVRCREVQNELPVIGTVTVLEATARAQEELVDEVLTMDDDLRGTDTPDRKIKEGDPYGAVLWPAAWAVANYALTTPDIRDNLSTTSILELGTGTGLCSVAMAMAGAKKVMATDYEPLALTLTSFAAKELQKVQSGSMVKVETQLLDLCDQHTPLPKEYDLVLAADVMYEPKTGAALAHRVAEAIQNKCRVIIGDSKLFCGHLGGYEHCNVSSPSQHFHE